MDKNTTAPHLITYITENGVELLISEITGNILAYPVPQQKNHTYFNYLPQYLLHNFISNQMKLLATYVTHGIHAW